MRSRCCLLILPLLGGCALLTKPAVAVKQVGPDRVYEQLNANAMNGDEPSTVAREVLHFFDLEESFEDDPAAALVELHVATTAEPFRSFLYALAELSFLTGKRLGDRDHFLAASVYAWLYLLGDDLQDEPNPYDRRFRWACELYNRGLERAFSSEDGESFVFEGGLRELPGGTIDVRVDTSAFPFDVEDYTFVTADDFLVEGLSFRVRDSGLGAPLIAFDPEARKAGDLLRRFRSERSNVPATAFLRVEGGISDLQAGIRATLELYSAYDALELDVGDDRVPLETDVSATLAYALHESKIWDFSLRGFFEGRKAARENKLFMGRPYLPGRVPVVFVHGTASNPAHWAEMFNTLQADPVLRARTQFWFYIYTTGNPIAYSAATLRDDLNEIVELLDPDGNDPALRRMVVIGHSQGGLLTKMMVVDGSIGWFEGLLETSVDELDLDADQEELLDWAFEFDPVPHVERVVFISTPHRGSFLAARGFARWIAKMIAVPGELTDLGTRIFRDETKLPAGMQKRIPTSLDNMDPSNGFLGVLADAPIAPGVTIHSIIAIGDAEDLEEADDGVVEYSSAHIEGVASEFHVRSGHSCQSHPRVIQEVRRILLEHLAEQTE
ncbi:MAG: alpha/beta fold hydrolase [Planctomycetota bacterium]|nr:alpha/beta fold hydrolase [Planctomycetota bacterium]